MNGYEKIIAEQLTSLKRSKILTIADLTLGVVGIDTIQTEVEADIHYLGNVNQYEYPTLHLLWEYCKQNKNAYVLYIHSKGVSAPSSDYKKHLWRYEMMGNVRNWKKCIKELEKGYSMVSSGTKWMTNAGGEKFWAGTFFWSNSDYISKLPDPLEIPSRFESSRWYAELWPSCHPIDYTISEIPKTKIEMILYSFTFIFAKTRFRIVRKLHSIFSTKQDK